MGRVPKSSGDRMTKLTCVVLLFASVACDKRQSAPPPAQASAGSSAKAAPASATTNGSKKITAKLGGFGQVGPLEYLMVEAEWFDVLNKGEFDEQKPDASFCMIKFAVTNKGDAPV